MGRSRGEADAQIAALLNKARKSLGLSMAFLTRMEGDTQTLEVVDSSIPFIKDGVKQDRSTSFCQAILDGKLPDVIPDVTEHDYAMSLPAARMPRIRKYISVPIVLSDGSLYGTFCVAGLRKDRELQARDRALMEVLADAARMIIEPRVADERRSAELSARFEPVVAAGGPDIVVQHVVSLPDGSVVGVEALSRFPPTWQLAPDVCFAQASEIGLGGELELLAVVRAAEAVDDVDGYVAINLSPSVLVGQRAQNLLSALPLDHIVLELSEHQAVGDYDELMTVLAPLRANGMRLAIDDVGAGFSSLRHIVRTGPDIIKLDREIVAGVVSDSVLPTVIRSLVQLADACGATTVAEGIETAADAAMLAELGVTHGQGWHFGRPAPVVARSTAGT